MNIYDFIDNPFRAVRAGYRPTYLTCVSCVAHQWRPVCKLALEEVAELRHVLNMTVTEIIACTIHIVFRTAAVVSFPVSVWLFAWIQYLNVQHTIKNLEELDKLQ